MKRPHKIIVLTLCTIFSLIQVSLAQELPFDENTVALWRFDEGEGDVAADESDNQYQLDLSNGAAWTEEGWSNSAADMTDEDARLTSDLLIGNGWDALSIDAYIYPTAINNEHPILYRMDWHNVSDPSYYLALYAEGQLAAGVYLNNPGGEKVDVISENGVIETDEWYKVSMTWSTGEPVRIYLNDELIAESNEIEDGTVRSGNDPMRVGCGYQGRYGWFYFQGLIDEVRVSNVDRSHLDEPRILHVPDDYETIQEAIDDSQDGDIVLVDPGEYVENIDFIGKNIIVASLFITDGDEDYIEETIIDGDEDGSVVTFDNGETEDAVLTGFTIRNGTRSHGGGIYCLDSNPALSNLSVIGNSADEQGGGIYCFHSNPSLNRVNISENSASDGGGISCERSNPVIVDVLISNNSVTVSGGGIYCGEAHPRLERVLISGNSAGEYGGGIHIVGNSSIILDNVTVSGNSSDQSGGAIRIHVNSDATIHNSIFYGNSVPEIALGRGERNNATLSYSDIEGGIDDIEIEEGSVNWGEGNINADPLFADPDDGNYHLTANSPCIDAGDPDSPEDPDGTRADMGAFYFDYRYRLVEIGFFDTPDFAYRVKVVEEFAYVADRASGMQVIDVSNPENPAGAGSYNTPDRAVDVSVAGNYAYIADCEAGLVIVDVTDPENPSRVSEVDMGFAYGLDVDGNYAYVCDHRAGLRVIDVSDPDNPEQVGFYDREWANDADVVGNYCYLGYNGGLLVIDVSDPTNPELLDDLEFTQGSEIKVIGDIAYVAASHDGLKIIDVSDPSNIVEIATFDTPSIARAVSVSGDYAFITDDESGIHMIDISNPDDPVGVCSHNTPSRPHGVDVVENLVYVADAESGLRIYEFFHRRDIPPLEWSISIDASVGNYNDNTNYAGGAEGAEWGFDEMDIPEPPHAPQNFIQVYFPHPDWEHDLFENFTTDIVPAGGYVDNTIVWDFQVNTDQEDETVTLTFNPEDMPDEDIPLLLVDPVAETIQNLWDENVYQYNSGEGGIREFLLVYGITPAYMEREFHAGWSLLSLPLRPASNSIDDVFGDDIDDPYFVFGYSREEGFYLTDEVYCGPGYWLASYADVTLDVEGLADSGEVVMELDLGWNLIGCPYPWVTSLNEMHIIDGIDTYTVPEAADAGLIQNILYTRQAPDNEYTEGIELESWYGYWFMALDEGLRLLLHPVMPEDDDNRVPGRDESDEGTIESWDLRIVAGIDGAVDRITRLGVDTSATDGFDAAFDYPEPPVPPSGTYITAYFDYPDWNEIIGRRYNRDIRQVLEPETSGRWTLTVTTSDTCRVMLSWHDISLSAPEQFGFTLEDPVNSQSVDMFAEQSYSYISTGIHAFYILVEAHHPADVNESLLGIPAEYYLSQAYPNPFNTFTRFAFGLPAAGTVELTVWDIGGRRVRTLASGSYQAGRYEVIWNAGNLPTGLYLAKIRANQYSAVRKMLLVK